MTPPDPDPTLKTVLRRALRLRCPACGRGPVFRAGFRRAPACVACGRRLDRDEGHWLGGTEVHMAGTWGLSVMVAVPLALLVDLSGWGVAALVAGHVAASLALYRHSRAVFLACDHWLDPSDEPAPGGGGRFGSDPGPDGRPATGPGGAGRSAGGSTRRAARHPS